MLIHINANMQEPSYMDAIIKLLLPDGTTISCNERRYKESDTKMRGDQLALIWGTHGAFVLELPLQPEMSAFTIAVNDQPLLSANLRNAEFRSF